jgi:uncharacterized protein YukE
MPNIIASGSGHYTYSSGRPHESPYRRVGRASEDTVEGLENLQVETRSATSSFEEARRRLLDSLSGRSDD